MLWAVQSFLTVSFSHQNKFKEKVFYGFVVCYRSCVLIHFCNRPMIFEITIKCQLPLRNSSALLRCFCVVLATVTSQKDGIHETFMLIKILTLCKFSMSFSWFLNSVKVGLASGSFFQHFIMIWYLELFKWSVRDLNNVSQYNKRERFEKENLQVFIYMLWFRHPVSILK